MIHDCVYATAGWGAHDERWVGALLKVGLTPRVISLARDVPDALELRLAVAEAAAGGRPVLAGPLNAVVRPLADLGVHLVGLCAAEDLEPTTAAEDVRSLLSHVPRLIVDSESTLALAIAAGADPSRVTVLPPGVDLQAFPFHAPWIDAFQLGVPPHAHLVLSLDAHEEGRRVDLILDAFARLERRAGLHEDFPDPYLILANDGPLADALKDRARTLGIANRTRFLGRPPNEDLVPLLGRAACYVTAAESVEDHSVLLQAMACGTPVIANDTVGNRAWIRHGDTGFLYRTRDVAALADRIDNVNHLYPTETVLRARRLVEAAADWNENVTRLRTAMQPA